MGEIGGDMKVTDYPRENEEWDAVWPRTKENLLLIAWRKFCTEGVKYQTGDTGPK